MSHEKKEEEAQRILSDATGAACSHAGSATGEFGSASGSAFKPGDMIAERYKVLSLVGSGASGSVYEVEQVFMKRRFALKTLNAEANSPLLQRRFQKEAQAAGILDHPNLVRAVDFGILHGNRPFMVMDFVEGRTLSQHLKSVGRLSLDEALSYFIPICFGLDYAHERGIVHRDIKPSNIVLEVSSDGAALVPRVVDFGIARLTEESETEALTRTGEVFGTPYYMSPEQCSGAKVDRRSDIYSFGCVVYEALSGSPPFCAQTALETMMKHRTELAAPLGEASLGETFSPAVESVVQKMLAKDPDDRYQTFAEVAEELMRLQSGKSVKATTAPRPQAATVSPGRRPVSPYLYLAVVPVALLALAGLILMRPTKPIEPVKITADVQSLETRAKRENDAVEQYCRVDKDGNRTFYFGERPGTH